jgi:endonuclease-3
VKGAAGRESAAAKRERAGRLFDGLAAAYPDVRIELHYGSDVELLIAVILSAQCTDKRVNLVTPALFARYRSAEAYAAARPTDLHRYIKSCGLYRTKAKSIVAACRALVQDHAGRVPTSRRELHALPGVGAKTAGVVTLHLPGGEPAFPVDTHVGRLARRMGFTRALPPDKVERDLQALLPPERWGLAHQLLVRHGRRCCTARAPRCDECPVVGQCPRRGVA